MYLNETPYTSNDGGTASMRHKFRHTANISNVDFVLWL